MSMQFDPELDDRALEGMKRMRDQMTPAGRLVDVDANGAIFNEAGWLIPSCCFAFEVSFSYPQSCSVPCLRLRY